MADNRAAANRIDQAALGVRGRTSALGLGSFIDGIILHQIAQWHKVGLALPPTGLLTLPEDRAALSLSIARES